MSTPGSNVAPRVLDRRLARERAARREAERIAEDATGRLYEHVRRLQDSRADLARWADHLEERLAEQVEALEDRNERLSLFARTVSHDLQAPLTSALLRVAMMDKKGTFDAADIDVLQRSLQRMSTMIRDLLATAQQGDDHGDDEVDLGSICSEVMELMPPGLVEADAIRIGALPRVRAPRVRMQQLLQNLLTNAAKYSAKEREPEIQVEAARQPDGSITIRVADNGIGFEPELAAELFKPGYRRATDRPGHGIGLATCKHIVEELGGRIDATGTPGEGATFTVWLPAVRVVAAGQG